MKPKFYDNLEISGKRINENLWFKQQQPLLLWMANQKYGRDLFCIDKHFPKIIEISKKHVTGHLGYEKIGKEYLHWKKSDIRIGAKWANVIRYRWKEFQEYALEYYRLKEPFLRRYPVLFPVVPQLGFAYTTSTYYPDPDPETTTVDGQVQKDSTADTFANIRAAAGTGFNDIGASTLVRIQCSGTPSGNYDSCYVGINLFDSGGGAGANDSPGIPDTDTITAATTSYYGDAKTDQLSQSAVLTNSNPDSNTALAAADYTDHTTVMNTELGTARITVANWSITGYNEFTITSPNTNVSKTGLTKLGIRVSADFDNAEPTWVASNQGRFTYLNAETAGSGSDPKLVVTHAGAAVAVSRLSSLHVG